MKLVLTVLALCLCLPAAPLIAKDLTFEIVKTPAAEGSLAPNWARLAITSS